MKLIVGGAWQGKLSFALELSGSEASVVAEGDKDGFDKAMTSPVIHHLQEYIRRLLQEGKDPGEFIDKLKEENPDVIVTSNELGCGIVPMDPFDRVWREQTGRAGEKLAKNCDEVYRVICGISARIK
ncbi:bifunctional adenosylcobinamide kinase/adenosylcobinamide-phosphate guanylyltransferase [Clostridium sp. E02]|uniref:bifunctional adenosylcobinamide kinase/adenosylcobinamide-phosphate guanylyltransferase n=1 Tax=Clostridium sp. E02 TaxID=2487134 RepID=UPI000F528AC8|nr:bifunctional adenosylcobinamide kinase/adenosylcobinamide-phosphate guanylyltransferase [Clostridium sp. E02]